MSIRLITISLLSTVIFASCNKSDGYQLDLKYDYYPLDYGHYVIYDVDSIAYNFATEDADTFQYQVMEKVDSAFVDLEGETAFEVERYHRKNEGDNWGTPKSWSAKIKGSSLEKVEDNLRFIKLVFPPQENYTWLGNSYITITDDNEYLENWEYEIMSVDEPYSVNGFDLDSTVTVLEWDSDESDRLQKVYSRTVYARGIGIVERELKVLNSNRIDINDWDNPEKWDKGGYILRMKLADYSD